MKTIDEQLFTKNLFSLLRETFEGPKPGKPSAYLDQNCGLFQTIDGLSAEEASRSVTPGGATIAGHCEHLRFYVGVLLGYMKGPLDNVDWKESWLVQSVTPEEWDALKGELRRSYESLTGSLRAIETWGDEPVGGGMAILAHTAYHLGAIRQILRAGQRN